MIATVTCSDMLSVSLDEIFKALKRKMTDLALRKVPNKELYWVLRNGRKVSLTPVGSAEARLIWSQIREKTAKRNARTMSGGRVSPFGASAIAAAATAAVGYNIGRETSFSLPTYSRRSHKPAAVVAAEKEVHNDAIVAEIEEAIVQAEAGVDRAEPPGTDLNDVLDPAAIASTTAGRFAAAARLRLRASQVASRARAVVAAQKAAAAESAAATAAAEVVAVRATDEASVEAAGNALKAEATALYRAENFAAAALKLSEAIALLPNNYLLYSNRALTNIRLESYEAALADANACIALNGRFTKCYRTKASAYEQLGNMAFAVRTMEEAVKIDNSVENRDYLDRLTEKILEGARS